jgi:dihydrolipoamide dehydrogenase
MATYSPRNVIIATGSVPIELPFLKFDEERILSNIGALSIPRVPQHLIVIGGGVIGLELGSVWRRLGAKVTVVELMPSILPGMDDDVVKECDRVFRRQGLDLRTGTRVVGGRRDVERVFVDIEKDGAKETLEGDYVLVSIGRKPFLGGIDAAALGLNVGRRGEILVDDQLRTGVPNVYAIGDCVPGPMLAHKAEEEAVACIESIAGHVGHVNYGVIPSVIYTAPEVAWVGQTEEELKAEGRAYKAGKFPFTANSRAKINHETEGFVKVLADAKTDEVLGVHMIGPSVSEMIGEYCVAMEFRAASEYVARTCHPHPTRSEALKQAAMGVEGWTMQA